MKGLVLEDMGKNSNGLGRPVRESLDYHRSTVKHTQYAGHYFSIA